MLLTSAAVAIVRTLTLLFLFARAVARSGLGSVLLTHDSYKL
jgi:hypothetical protein